MLPFDIAVNNSMPVLNSGELRVETVLCPCPDVIGQPYLLVDGQGMKIADTDLCLALCEDGHPLCEGRHPDRRHAEGRARGCNEFAPIYEHHSLRVNIIVPS